MGKSKRCSVCLKPVVAGQSLCAKCQDEVAANVAAPADPEPGEALDAATTPAIQGAVPEMIFGDDEEELSNPEDDDFGALVEPPVAALPTPEPAPLAVEELADDKAAKVEAPKETARAASPKPKKAAIPGTPKSNPKRAAKHLQAALAALKSLDPKDMPPGVSGSIAILEHALVAFAAKGAGAVTIPGTRVKLSKWGATRWAEVVLASARLTVVKTTPVGILVRVVDPSDDDPEASAISIMMAKGHIEVAS